MTTQPSTIESKPATTGTLRVAIIGGGHRSEAYANYALRRPEEMEVTAIADPDPVRRERLGDKFGIPPAQRFHSYEDVAARPDLAEAAINGTMDQLHYRSGMALLEAGYDMLLEKPIAQSLAETQELIDTAQRLDRQVMICHVLRYAPFYRTIFDLVAGGRIGRVLSLHTEENVSYHHMAVGYVRGKWNNRETEAPILLAKCCHDLDLIAWLLHDTEPVRVASFGSLSYFRKEHAPPGAGERCLDDCPLEADCIYSAGAHYLDSDVWGTYAWHDLEHLGQPTMEQKREHLRTASPFGRCVWKCDNNQVDHQTVMVEFANGVTASHDLHTGCARGTRTLHIVGTHGEITGDFDLAEIQLWTPRPRESGHDREIVAINQGSAGEEGGHGGGDSRLMADFVALCRGGSGTPALTRIEDSLHGHQIAFAADVAMCERRVVEIAEL